MDTPTVITLVVVAALVLVAVAVVGWLVRKKDERRRTEQLQERFGPEYDRTVESSEDRREAERELQQASERRDRLDIRPLTSASRTRRTEQWGTVQAMFVDAPVEAVESARSLVLDVMHERGYPTEDTDERARMLAADHGAVVDNHRGAETYRDRYRSGEGGTEDLRQAFVFYRRLFDTLVDDVADESRSTGRDDTRRDDGMRGEQGTSRDEGVRRDEETRRDDGMSRAESVRQDEGTLRDDVPQEGRTATLGDTSADGRHRADRPHEVDLREAPTDDSAARAAGATARDERR